MFDIAKIRFTKELESTVANRKSKIREIVKKADQVSKKIEAKSKSASAMSNVQTHFLLNCAFLQGTYKVTITCGDEIEDAVRDYSNVYIQLIGDKKSTDEMNLLDIRASVDRTAFAQDSKDIFNIKSAQLGKVNVLGALQGQILSENNVRLFC